MKEDGLEIVGCRFLSDEVIYIPMIDAEYLTSLKERASKSHVYKKHQSIGLLLAELLQDNTHKALYMKLAKTIHQDTLLRIAKDVSQRAQVKNKGAYFMRLLKEKKIL